MKNLSAPDLLKSKRFWVLCLSLIAYVVNEEMALQIDVQSWSLIALALIGGYSIEDWIEAWNDGKVAPTPKAEGQDFPPIRCGELFQAMTMQNPLALRGFLVTCQFQLSGNYASLSSLNIIAFYGLIYQLHRCTVQHQPHCHIGANARFVPKFQAHEF